MTEFEEYYRRPIFPQCNNSNAIMQEVMHRGISQRVFDLLENYYDDNLALIPGNTVSSEIFNKLILMIINNKFINRLKLAFWLTQQQMNDIFNIFKTNATISTLELDWGFLSVENLDNFCEVLRENKTLEKLVFNNCVIATIHNRIGAPRNINNLFEKIVNIISNSNIDNLNINGISMIRDITDVNSNHALLRHGDYFGKLFNSNLCRLRSLSLTKWNITEFEIDLIGKSLETNETLEILILDDNQLGDNQLDNTNINTNSIGVCKLMHYLKNNRTLTTLSLKFNKIGNNGAAAITNYLENSDCNLKELNIGSNFIDDDGMMLIIKALEDNLKSKLTCLIASYNHYSQLTTILAMNLLQLNKTLIELNVSFDPNRNFDMEEGFENVEYYDDQWIEYNTNLLHDNGTIRHINGIFQKDTRDKLRELCLRNSRNERMKEKSLQQRCWEHVKQLDNLAYLIPSHFSNIYN